MSTQKFVMRLLPLLLAASVQFGCSNEADNAPADDPYVGMEDRRPPRDLSHPPPHDMSGPRPDMGGPQPDLSGGPVPNPPPAMCNQRHAGVTAIQLLVQVDQYKGTIQGANGTHEIAEVTNIDTIWVYDSKVVDTKNIEVAMNVKSAKDPSGLPMEVPLSVGQVIEIEGEYIPAATAHAHNNNGAAAVLHYSHSPCGYVVINNHKYQ